MEPVQSADLWPNKDLSSSYLGVTAHFSLPLVLEWFWARKGEQINDEQAMNK